MLKVLKTCFSINLNEYENIGVDLEINKVLVIAFAAIIVGIILFNMYRQNIKLVVSQLIRHRAKSEDSAKTLGELGLHSNNAVRKMLLAENLLTRVVARCGERRFSHEEYKALTDEEKKEISTVDFDTARFYIREEKRTFAEGVVTRYNSSTPSTVISCVFAAIVCVCLVACMPGILNVINRILG